ncbi:hypothetical protein CLONEX_01235 [[Clostridium] nexile DSM 1787]|nr:hypothetical protein CLONEX_01235 [[Clostridium] nexile DSM 1787]
MVFSLESERKYDKIKALSYPILTIERGCACGNYYILFGFCHGKCS